MAPQMRRWVMGVVWVCCFVSGWGLGAGPVQAAPRSTITFENQTGEFALVRVVGKESHQTVAQSEVANGGNGTVHVGHGEYYLLIRYGLSGHYRVSKGDPFNVTETASQYSQLRITLHPVVAGNYSTHPVTLAEFDQAGAADSTAMTTAAAEVPPLGLAQPPDAPDLRAHGKELFEGRGRCAACHGRSGKGDGPAAGILNPKPTDLTNPRAVRFRTDADRLRILKDGIPGTAMVPLVPATISEEEAVAVMAYLHELLGEVPTHAAGAQPEIPHQPHPIRDGNDATHPATVAEFDRLGSAEGNSQRVVASVQPEVPHTPAASGATEAIRPKVRIIVKEFYSMAEHVSLPFSAYAERFLTRAGYEVVSEATKTAEATLQIEATGIPESAEYIGAGRLWSGTTVKGTISFTEGNETFRWDFKGTVGPPYSVKMVYAPTQSEDAPFREAFTRGFLRVMLTVIGERTGVPFFVATLQDEDRDVREAATDALITIGSPAVEPLIAALRDEAAHVRRQATEALRVIGDLKAVEPLMAALTDEDENVRGQAAEALGVIRDQKAVEPLMAALTDEDENVRGQAAEALGAIGDPRAVESLTAALQDDSYSVREAAAQGMRVIGDPKAVGALIAALKDESWRVRTKATRALGAIGDARAVEPLAAALHDEDGYVRKAAAQALEKLGRKPE